MKQNLSDDFGMMKNDSFEFELIESYFRKKNNSSALQTLSDKTCNDLDFQELFIFLDRTQSRVGQQYLYNKLRNIPSGKEDSSLHEKLIESFTTDTHFRTSVQTLLGKLNKPEAYYIASLFQDELLEPPKWFFVVPVLSFTSLLSLVAAFFNPAALFVTLAVFIVNMLIHYWNKRNLYHYYGSVPQLLILNAVAIKLFKVEMLQKLNPNLAQSIDTLNRIRLRMAFFKLEVKLQDDMQAIFWTVVELFKITFLLEPLVLFDALKQLDSKRSEIDSVFSFVGETDALLSVASLRKGCGSYCLPQINDTQKNILARDAYHPLIENCVKNSIHLQGKSILLTGSNMSGKTTFIRTIGINVITGLTLNTCFAEEFTMPRLKVYSAIRISDDLMNDKSYYFEEVLTIKEMIGKSQNGHPNLFLLDEIFKGTNTTERISAGKAVLSHLTKSQNIVFVSTHDIELTDLLKDEYELYHFSEIVNNKTVDFDYKIKEGKLKNRNAIRILQINDYPQTIIDEAMALSNQFDNTRPDH